MSGLLSRRWLLGAFGGGTAVLAAAAQRGSGGADSGEPAGDGGGRQALARRPTAPNARTVLDEGGRSGTFVWRVGNQEAAVRADPLQGLVIAHASVSPREGAWVREWDGREGRPEWFGARANDRGFDNQPAIQAALDLCATVQLGAGSYYTRSRLLIRRNGVQLVGAGVTQTDQGENRNSTQIVCTSASETILQIGSDSRSQPNPLIECVQLRDFTVRRDTAPSIPPGGLEGAIGIAMRWCVNCHVTRIFSIDSARGWHFYGTIENYVSYCSALRGRAGTNRGNDFFIGYHLDYRAPLAANGGNASLYFDHCRAFGGFGEGTPSLTYSAGLRTDGGWVDLFINAFETGTLQVGIDGYGDAYDGGNSFKTEDLIISNCVLDPGSVAGIRLQTADTSSAVQIMGSYMAVGGEGTAVVLRNLGGSISLDANQFIIGGRGGGGVSATNVNNLRCTNNIHTKLARPIRLANVTSFSLQDTIHSLDTGNGEAAIALAGCTRGRIDCILNGRGGSHGGAVHLAGTGNSLVEINCTNLQTQIAPNPAATVVHDRTPITRTGPFGNNCLATGILG